MLLVRATHGERSVALPAEVDEGDQPDQEQRDEQDQQDEVAVGGEQKDRHATDQQQQDDGEREEDTGLVASVVLLCGDYNNCDQFSNAANERGTSFAVVVVGGTCSFARAHLHHYLA